MNEQQQDNPGGSLLIYRADDSAAPIRVLLEGETVWLTQRLLADLYGTSIPNINQHITAIYEEEELRPEATLKKCLIVQTEGERQVKRLLDHYSLEMIIAIGYRVRSTRGTQFRQWATARLGEYLVKGFTLDDERLKGTDSPADSGCRAPAWGQTPRLRRHVSYSRRWSGRPAFPRWSEGMRKIALLSQGLVA